ncbi:MAG: cysteine desulfurase [Gemmatimonadetes bacterium]|nr:cysteine desulfurase [Gemmatimonadota bacterium]
MATRSVAAPVASRAPLDVERIRRDFPVLNRTVNGKPLVYLDSAATSQKPRVVIETLQRYYSAENANIHRGVYYLSERATEAYEAARTRAARFLGAPDPREVVFVRGTTEAINLVAYTFGRTRIGQGDEVVLSAMEHHSNIVPWQMACEAGGARLRVAPINDRGELLLEEYQRLLGPRTRLVAITHVSNALGTVTPVREIIELAHAKGVPVLVDGAQAAPHQRLDMRELGCDFYAVSGHKMFGPMGIGLLYGKAQHLEAMPPFHGGGDMIRSVTFERTEYAPIPAKFEAGTPNVAGVAGLVAAIDYLEGIGWDAIAGHEAELVRHATEALARVPGVRLVGTAAERASVVSFVLEGVHAHDVGTIADHDGIAIRAGHHCAQPVMDRFGIPATARASFAFYNTHEEVEALVAAVTRARKVFG